MGFTPFAPVDASIGATRWTMRRFTRPINYRPLLSEESQPVMSTNRRHCLQLLAHLDALVSEKHVTRAAEKMDIGQPAMSGALARLREMFNDPILVRTGAGMEPTERALMLTRKINEAMRLIEDAINRDDRVDLSEATGNVRVMVSAGIVALLLPRLLQGIRAPSLN